MTAVDIIARIFGPFYIIVAIALLVNADTYRQMIEDFIEEPAFTYMGGFMALTIGLLILNFHNAWSADWRGLVTLLGWAATAKGATLIVWPQAFAGLTRTITGSTAGLRVMAAVALALGLYLGAGGYGLI